MSQGSKATTTWYFFNHYSLTLTEVQVERESDLCVWKNGHREAKLSEWGRYFKTSEQAFEFTRHRVEEKMRNLEIELDQHRATLAGLK